MKLQHLILLYQFASSSFPTCPQQASKGLEACESIAGCIFLQWKQDCIERETCSYDCAQYQPYQDQCMLLYNCKWDGGFCVHKECLDYTMQGPQTCLYEPGCEWHWNKCRKASCGILKAKDQIQCSRTYCNYIDSQCVDKKCEDYSEMGQAFCQSIGQCYWSSSCVDVVVPK